ncbi:hypothetical protein [Actinophytocola sp.]|jgi:hypothetical protein|uniref:hypothetical protein n=1 Tax=Actinophytocola sp. TaxID=1872138 RepID=UPI002ED7F1EB
MARRIRLCHNCVLGTLAGVAWQMWGGRPEGWPQLTRCESCTTGSAGDRPPLTGSTDRLSLTGSR